MKETSFFIQKDKLPFLQKACRGNMMSIIEIKENDKGLYEIFIQYDPAFMGLIFTELFYAGSFYSISKM